MIHPTAIVHPNAKIHPTVEVGAFAVIDEFVQLGAGCKVDHHCCITGHTTAGEKNYFGIGAVIGAEPQDLKYSGGPTRLRIGNGNTFREMVTLHCSNNLDEDTVIGDNCLLMANVHIAHNSVLGNNIILANSALVGGHVHIGNRAVLSGNTAVHQFVRIGDLGMLQGVSAVSADIPPYTIAYDKNLLAGLNIVGLRRAGISSEVRLEIKRAYHILFCSGLKRADTIEQARQAVHSAEALKLVEFVQTATRPICMPRISRRANLGGEETSE
ncbi:MAG: acyl-ACP--UDP-N-acetylglucosamine O-acyltransferase [Verrucomicrobia bacterium]|nr:acyl-ACP--UDP-N-acetylglucosamine O-acyltransferase [Verrucomicrobiota bacterium]